MAQPQWVELFLEPQSERSDMPPSIIGLLTSQTLTDYVLNPMLQIMVDDETFEKTLEPVGMNFISRTYVWRCKVLEQMPDINLMEQNTSEVNNDGL